MRLKVRLSALVAQLQLIVRLSGPSSSSTEKEAHEGIREGERHSMCSCSIGDVAGVGSADDLTNWDGHAQASANLPYLPRRPRWSSCGRSCLNLYFITARVVSTSAAGTLTTSSRRKTTDFPHNSALQ